MSLEEIAKLGLTGAYHAKATLRKEFKMIKCLPFIKPTQVIRLFNEFKCNFDNDLIPFMDYFEKTWLHGNFSVELWNLYDLEICRTNNSVESWNRKFNDLIAKPHPNIFELIKCLKLDEILTRKALVDSGNFLLAIIFNSKLEKQIIKKKKTNLEGFNERLKALTDSYKGKKLSDINLIEKIIDELESIQ